MARAMPTMKKCKRCVTKYMYEHFQRWDEKKGKFRFYNICNFCFTGTSWLDKKTKAYESKKV